TGMAASARPAGASQQTAAQPATAPGLRILTETVTSPTLAYQIMGLVNSLGSARWHQYEPAGNANAIEGARLAFGRPISTVYDFSKADVIVSLDSDFLSCGAG